MDNTYHNLSIQDIGQWLEQGKNPMLGLLRFDPVTEAPQGGTLVVELNPTLIQT